MIKRL